MILLIAVFFLWLLFILSAFIWLIVKVVHKLKKQTSWFEVFLPFSILTFLTWPMLGQPIADDLSCRTAGLQLSPPIDAKNEGVYWNSINPSANVYSMGFPYTTNNSNTMIMAVLRRALLEGRIAYLEFPAAPNNYQRILLTQTDGIDVEKTHCFSDLEGNNYKPENMDKVCIAYQLITEVSSRYEIVTHSLDQYNTGSLEIIDRNKLIFNKIAKYSIGSVSSSRWVSRLPTPSCTPDKLDSLPLSNLILMQFTDKAGNVSERKDLVKFEDLNWSPSELPNIGVH